MEKNSHAVVLYDSVVLSDKPDEAPDTPQQVLVITGHVEENEKKKFSTIISKVILQCGMYLLYPVFNIISLISDVN